MYDSNQNFIKQKIAEMFKMKPFKTLKATYQGSGDSGDFDELLFNSNLDNPNLLDSQSNNNSDNVEPDQEFQIRDNLFDILENFVPGWEINEGSYGNIFIEIDKDLNCSYCHIHNSFYEFIETNTITIQKSSVNSNYEILNSFLEKNKNNNKKYPYKIKICYVCEEENISFDPEEQQMLEENLENLFIYYISNIFNEEYDKKICDYFSGSVELSKDENEDIIININYPIIDSREEYISFNFNLLLELKP